MGEKVHRHGSQLSCDLWAGGGEGLGDKAGRAGLNGAREANAAKLARAPAAFRRMRRARREW